MFERNLGKVNLKVKAQSPLDEVYLLDSGLRRVAKGIGGLAVTVDPGIYKVKFKSGDAVLEETVFLNQADVDVEGAAIQLNSAIPIDRADVQTSKGSPKKLTSTAPGGGLGKATDAVPGAEPAAPSAVTWNGSGAGFSFHLSTSTKRRTKTVLRAARVIDDAGSEFEVVADDREVNRFVDCAPGNYVLRVNAGEMGNIDMCLPATVGWRTSVFLPIREAGYARPVQIPDVANAGIILARLTKSIGPSDPSVRWTEQARLALAGGRAVAPKDQFRDLLKTDWDEPMYLLLGAHLLLLESTPDQDLLRAIVGRLESMLAGHPDVQILSLYCRRTESPPPSPLEIAWPPMLVHTWKLLDDPYMRERVVIRPNSTAAAARQSPWNGSIWFLWRSWSSSRRAR